MNIQIHSVVKSFIWFIGCKNVERLREKLLTNVRQNNRHSLEQCIDECVSVGHCELWPDIEFVRENIDSLLNRPDRG